MDFKPQTYENILVKAHQVIVPVIGSYKLDGIRTEYVVGEMLSRSLKNIQNKQLRRRFQHLIDFSKKHNIILDGEIYGHGMTFQEITHFVMTKDLDDPKTQKKILKDVRDNHFPGRSYTWLTTLPEELHFHCFDIVLNEDYAETYEKRLYMLHDRKIAAFPYVTVVRTQLLESAEDIKEFFNEALDAGYEGLILRSPTSPYKCGQAKISKGAGYKFKPYETHDTKIIDVEEGTVIKAGVQRTINELGRSVTSKKQGDREPSGKASAFWVMYQGTKLKVSLAKTEEDKKACKIDKDYFQKKLRDYLVNKDKYIGRMIEYKGMQIGSKDVPRHPTFVRFREDKDE